MTKSNKKRPRILKGQDFVERDTAVSVESTAPDKVGNWAGENVFSAVKKLKAQSISHSTLLPFTFISLSSTPLYLSDDVSILKLMSLRYSVLNLLFNSKEFCPE